MKTIKIIAVIASVLFLILLILLGTVQNPLEKQYQLTLSTLMDTQAYASEAAVLQNYPELADIKAQMEQIRHWDNDIRKVTLHPIPPKRGAATKELTRKMKAVKQERQLLAQRLEMIQIMETQRKAIVKNQGIINSQSRFLNNFNIKRP